MASTFTPNIQWEEPARGDDVGTWDTPVNNNGTLIDLVTGAIATIALNNANVVLSAAQFRSKQITFNSTLTGSVSITFPTSFTKSYEIQNLCTGSSAFTITLTTTATGGHVICAPPGEIVDCVNDGTNLTYKNLGRIGTYWDYAGGGVPNWVSGCSVQPYLNCDGSVFSSVTYPQLAVILGGTTLPDSRGRNRLALNQGTGRVTTANGGVDGNTNFAAGGAPNHTLTAGETPALSGSNTITVSASNGGTIVTVAAGFAISGRQFGQALGGDNNFAPIVGGSVWGGVANLSLANNITVNSGGGGGHVIMNPTYVGGITMVRAG